MEQPQSRTRAPILRPGVRLDPDLTVIDHLGGRRKADLYLCRSKRFRGPVASKVLRPEHAIQASAHHAFLKEGERLLHLRHPNVVEGYSVEVEDHPLIVMQYLSGQTVAIAFLRGNYEAFEIAHVISAIVQVADALSYIHQQGLLHLDVKPSNVMYEDGHVTLFDFSAAKPYSPEKPLRTSAGTPNYKAPEQTYRREAGYSTDVFGLGVLSYQLLTGGPLPYRSVETTDADGKTRRLLDYSLPPKPPSSLNPGLPQAIDSVTLAAISPEPAERFATPHEFKAALVEAIQ